MTTGQIWRGDPVDRRGQEVAAAELRTAYIADQDGERVGKEHAEVGRKMNAYFAKRDASLGLIKELRYSLEEAAKCLAAMDADFANVDLGGFIDMAKRLEIRKCNACQRATVDLWETSGKREGFATCKDHTVPAPRPRPALLVEDHAELHGAIAEALLSEGIDLLDNEHDMATKVMDVLVRRKVIPPPDGYNADLLPVAAGGPDDN